MDEFEIELKKGFLEEASQNLEEVEQCFLQLENTPDDETLIDKIFRVAHNIKGSSRAVGFNQLGEFTHIFENLLLKIKQKTIAVTPAVVSLLLKSNDHVKYFIDQLKGDLGASVDSTELVAELESAINGNLESQNSNESTINVSASSHETSINKVSPVADESVIAAGHTESVSSAQESDFITSIGESPAVVVPDASLFEEAEPDNAVSAETPVPELVSAQPVMSNVVSVEPKKEVVMNAKPQVAASESAASAKQEKKAVSVTDETIRVSLSQLEKLINYVGEMVILQTVLREQAYQQSSPLLRKTVHQLGRVSKELQDLSMGLRMLPIKPVFQKMQRIVRDTSNALNKKINFNLQGEETAVDKTVLDLIGDPLVHLVRNAVDHGIESAEKRIAAGKSSEGNIYLKAFHKGDKLVIEVQDDGGGIDHNVLFQKAVEKGVVSANAKMTQKEMVDLVFHPGFSTKAQTTEISGRGVGMDVVRSNIDNLQGMIEIETAIGKGSVFRITLPLTLAIVDGLVFVSDNEYYVVPLSQVQGSLKPTKEQVQFNKGVGETLLARGQNIPLYRLSHLINKASKVKKIEEGIAVIVKGIQKDFALLVDDIANQQQVVIKKLGVELQYMKGFTGSAILGNGRPALILEPTELVNYCLKENKAILDHKEAA